MKKRISEIIKKKGKSKIVCLTAYSKNIAKILDRHCDLILVGDSVANVLYGMKNTHSINLDIMIKHATSVKTGVEKSLVVVDMPKDSYKNITDAKRNAKKIIKQTKCDAIKLESNGKNHSIIKELVKINIPVMGHIGFTPQFYKNFKVKGRTRSEERMLIKEAKLIEHAGAFSMVIECIAANAAKNITNSIKIPTIGIGSSKYCDGQILVTDDILGLSGFYPKFVKKYTNLSNIIKNVVIKYKKEVIKKKFPTKKNSY
jgi:3-methyl-2-oxobutanoate hydroxymethyltransferase